MKQPLPYDKNEMWHGHPDLYMNTLQQTLNPRDDSDLRYFVEVNSNFPDNLKEKTKKSLLLAKVKEGFYEKNRI